MNTLSKSNQNKNAQQIGMGGFKKLINEMKAKQFDSIRFAAYRTACKLRYIQQRTRLILLDVRGVVESFRQSGVYLMEPGCSLDRPQIEAMVSQLYTQLAARLPAGDQLHPNIVPESIEMLLGWLLYSYDTSGTGRLTVMALKVALSTLASGKPIEKFKYHFTLLTDPSGALIPTRFEQYLHDLLVLAVGVFEGPNFAYNSQASKFILGGRSKAIVIEEFLEKMLADPGPQCLLWLNIFHRLSNIENVRHNVRCEGCHREVIIGFRYKCQKCHNYNLCQDCFWTGVTTGNHSNSHDVKEYTSSSVSKSHSRQFGHAIRKSWDRQNNVGMVTCTGGKTPMKEYHHHPHHPQQHQSQQAALASAVAVGGAGVAGGGGGVVMGGGAGGGGTGGCGVSAVSSASYQKFSVANDNGGPSLSRYNKMGTATVTPIGQASPCMPYRNTVARIQAADCSGQFRGSPSQTVGSGIDHLMSMHNNNNQWPDGAGYRAAVATSSMTPIVHSHTGNVPTKDWRQFYHDDEHRLIARYANTLANSRTSHAHLDGPGGSGTATSSSGTDAVDAPKIEVHLRSEPFNQNIPPTAESQKELIAKLEAKNREILREIQRLRLEQQQNASAERAAANKTNAGPAGAGAGNMGAGSGDAVGAGVTNPNLLAELRSLRHRKDELESRMNSLQDSRLELMQQLESLMHVLNTSSSSSNNPVGASNSANPMTATSAMLTSLKSRSLGPPLSVAASGSRGVPSANVGGSSGGPGGALLGYGSPMATHRSFSYSAATGTDPMSHGPMSSMQQSQHHSILGSGVRSLGAGIGGSIGLGQPPPPRFNTLTRHSRTFSADEGLGGFGTVGGSGLGGTGSHSRRYVSSGSRTLESLGVDTDSFHLKSFTDRPIRMSGKDHQGDLRNDLLAAADNVTSAMSGLVRELQPPPSSLPLPASSVSTSRGMPISNNSGIASCAAAGTATGAGDTSDYEQQQQQQQQQQHRGYQDDPGLVRRSTVNSSQINPGSVSTSIFSSSRISSRVLTDQRFLNELRARRQIGPPSDNLLGDSPPPPSSHTLVSSGTGDMSGGGGGGGGNMSAGTVSGSGGVKTSGGVGRVVTAPPPLPPHRSRTFATHNGSGGGGGGGSGSGGYMSNHHHQRHQQQHPIPPPHQTGGNSAVESDSEAYLYSDPECSLMRHNSSSNNNNNGMTSSGGPGMGMDDLDNRGPSYSLGRSRERSLPMEKDRLMDIQNINQKISSLNNGDIDQDFRIRHKDTGQNWEDSINRWINE